MSMSTTRNLRNRSSRYSSPATFAESQNGSKTVHTQSVSNAAQTSLDKWVEPSVRSLVPSFEDTKGLERVGVLEHMVPLGVAPSQKLLQKLKVNLNRMSPRATPIHPGEVTPPMEAIRIGDTPPADEESSPGPDEDGERMIILSPQRGRPAKKELDTMKQASDITATSPTKSSFGSASRPQSIQDFIRQDRIKSVIEQTIAKAQQHSDRHLVPGLQQMLEDAKTNPLLWNVLDAILTKSPNDAQFWVFKRYIKRGAKRYRRGLSTPGIKSDLDQPNSPRPRSFARSPKASGINTASRWDTSSYMLTSPGPPSPSFDEAEDAERPPKAAPAMAGTHAQPSSRRKRSQSHSSTSSLSSAKSMPEDFSPETVEVDIEGENHTLDGRPVRVSGQRQAPSRVAPGSRTRSSIAPQPEVPLTASITPTISLISQKKPRLPNKFEEAALPDLERIEARRREFEGSSFINYNNISRPESDERTRLINCSPSRETQLQQMPPPVLHPEPLASSAPALLSPSMLHRRTDHPIFNGTSKKRTHDEMMEEDDFDVTTPLSSSPPSFPPPPQSDAAQSAGSLTPRPSRLPPPTKARKSARVMISPNKSKNGGITAGISRAGPPRDSAIGNGAESGGEDNDEFCASCGGEGTLLCCDGCTNSFHHGCLEPPLNPDDDVEGAWYCPRCVARRNKELSPATGLMGQVVRRLNQTIPRAYALPFSIRDYFEGVKTGDEGEYEETSLPRTQNTGAKMNRAGFFEEPSYKELRDTKGNFIVCYRCQKTSNDRDIIPCDYCPAKWHMDCVDPPLAVPPRRRGGDKPAGSWRCPLHVDGDLAAISRQVEAAPGDLGRIPRLRKPKDAIPVDIDLARGFRNNGMVEIELMKDRLPDIREVTLEHGIYRLPEKGVRLDFIDRVKKSWYEDQVLPSYVNKDRRIRTQIYRPDDLRHQHSAASNSVELRQSKPLRSSQSKHAAEAVDTNFRLSHKSFPEQKAIMSLLSLSDRAVEPESADPLAVLTHALISEAPEDVTEAINASEKELLFGLQRLIDRRLALLEGQDDLKSTNQSDVATPRSEMLTTNSSHYNPAMMPEKINGEANMTADGSFAHEDEDHVTSRMVVGA